VSKTLLDGMDGLARAGRLSLPWAMFAYPFYLWKRSPGKEGSHFDPGCDRFTPAEAPLVTTSNAFLAAQVAAPSFSPFFPLFLHRQRDRRRGMVGQEDLQSKPVHTGRHRPFRDVDTQV